LNFVLKCGLFGFDSVVSDVVDCAMA